MIVLGLKMIFYSRKKFNKLSIEISIITKVNKNRRIRTKKFLCHNPSDKYSKIRRFIVNWI